MYRTHITNGLERKIMKTGWVGKKNKNVFSFQIRKMKRKKYADYEATSSEPSQCLNWPHISPDKHCEGSPVFELEAPAIKEPHEAQ